MFGQQLMSWQQRQKNVDCSKRPFIWSSSTLICAKNVQIFFSETIFSKQTGISVDHWPAAKVGNFWLLQSHTHTLSLSLTHTHISSFCQFIYYLDSYTYNPQRVSSPESLIFTWERLERKD
jgi:hypothetical protein